MDYHSMETIDELATKYGETLARIYCLTTAYEFMQYGCKQKAEKYYIKAKEFHNCDYVFGVMDLRYEIKKWLSEENNEQKRE